MKLKLSQVKMIYETIISTQECEFTALMRHKLRLVRNETEPVYQSLVTESDLLIKKHNGTSLDDQRVKFTNNEGVASKENLEAYLKEYNELLEDEKEYNIDLIPLDLQLLQGSLPGKFDFNLDPILAKE